MKSSRTSIPSLGQRRPDPERSHAVLVGVRRYAHFGLPAIPAVSGNLADLHQLLTTPETGPFRLDQCHTVLNPDYAGPIGTAVQDAASNATDVLLVYYTGHGLLDRRGRLHLAVGSSDPDRIGFTALSFDTLREEIVDSPAEIRILILDCCFSGRAFEALSTPSSVVSGQLDVSGTYTIASSGANQTSFAPDGHRNTAFTAALLASARELPGGTVDELYRNVEQNLASRGYPRPRRRSVDGAGRLVLFRGHRPRPLSLARGQRITLRKEHDPALTFVKMGVGWDPVQSKGAFGNRAVDADLDASVVLFADGKPIDYAYYGQLITRDGSVRHQGDNLTGEGFAGDDDEVILVDLMRVPAHVDSLIFLVTSYKGHTLDQVQNAFCRLVDGRDVELVRYTLTGRMPFIAMAVAKVFRVGSEWCLVSIDEGIDASSLADAISKLDKYVAQ